MAEIIIFSDVNGVFGVSRYAGPYRIATELRSHGFNVQVIDFFASFDINTICRILSVHVDKSTLFVGFSTTLWTKYISDQDLKELYLNTNTSLRTIIASNYVRLFPLIDDEMRVIFEFIKSKNNKAKIVVGGYKAANYDTQGVDYWILGQAERSSVALANHLKYSTPLKTIKTDWGNIITEKMYQYNDFSKSKIIYDKTDYIFENENLPIETARGCVFACSFCAFNLNGKKFGDYTKEKEVLQEEFIRNYELYGTTGYMISDDTLNDSMNKVRFLYDVISELPFKIEFSAYSRLEIMSKSKEMPYMLEEIGLRSVEFGIETMNKKTGSFIGKRGDRKIIEKDLHMLKDIWKEKVYIAAGFIVGLPYEDEASIRETMEWLYRKDNPLDGIQLNRYAFSVPPIISVDDAEKYNLENAGFYKTPKGYVYENVSKIFANPAAYGYSMEKERDNNRWTNTCLTVEKAIELEKEFYDDSRARQKKSMSIFQYYNRMKNIGYTHEEIKDLYYDDLDFVENAIARRINIKNNYLQKIL